MKERQFNQIFDVQDTLNQLLINPNAYQKVQKWAERHGYFMQQAFQTAGIKMPDLKKIASDDPVVSLAQQINANPAIKKQVLKYLNAVT